MPTYSLVVVNQLANRYRIKDSNYQQFRDVAFGPLIVMFWLHFRHFRNGDATTVFPAC